MQKVTIALLVLILIASIATLKCAYYAERHAGDAGFYASEAVSAATKAIEEAAEARKAATEAVKEAIDARKAAEDGDIDIKRQREMVANAKQMLINKDMANGAKFEPRSKDFAMVFKDHVRHCRRMDDSIHSISCNIITLEAWESLKKSGY